MLSLKSTKSMRKEGGFEVIKKAIEKLGLRHKENIASYGEENERRLIGRHGTSDINTFSCLPFVVAMKGYKLLLIMVSYTILEWRVTMLAFGSKLILTDLDKGMEGVIKKVG
ncbi:hypothetical protein SUGI_0459980 [Cryptomeria japonica]|nr:hypothetical protein SUGI_0459980 [Cryptomeria japonica]